MNQFVGGVKQYKGKHYMATKMFRRPWLKKKIQTRRTFKDVTECSVARVNGTSPGKCMNPMELSSAQNPLFVPGLFLWLAHPLPEV